MYVVIWDQKHTIQLVFLKKKKKSNLDLNNANGPIKFVEVNILTPNDIIIVALL